MVASIRKPWVSEDYTIFFHFWQFMHVLIDLNAFADTAGMTVRQKKTATSEPKLFKTNVFSRQKAMRHTFRFSKQDSGAVRKIDYFIT